MDFLCVAMIVQIKEELLESDFSMCMAYLLNYKGPEDPRLLLRQATAIRERLKEPPEVKTPNDFFDNLKRMGKVAKEV